MCLTTKVKLPTAIEFRPVVRRDVRWKLLVIRSTIWTERAAIERLEPFERAQFTL